MGEVHRLKNTPVCISSELVKSDPGPMLNYSMVCLEAFDTRGHVRSIAKPLHGLGTNHRPTDVH